MKYREALIAWNQNGEVKVGPYKNNREWSQPYRNTAGAAFVGVRELSGEATERMIFMDFHMLVVRDGIDPKQAHAEFLKIDEYRWSISPDIHGAEGRPGGGVTDG